MLGWAIKHWNGELYIDTVRRTRAEAIECFKNQFGIDDKTWKDNSRFGVHRAVKVEIKKWEGH